MLPVILALIAMYSCSCKTCGINSDGIEVPESVFARTDKFIQSKVGKDFFDNYIHADYMNSRKKGDKHEVRYNFRMIDYDFVDEEILIVTDSLGNIPKGSLVKGIPNCMNGEGCDFTIDKNRAVEIGVANYLPEGIKEWMVDFRWSEVARKYVWHLIATTSEFGSGNNYKAEGEELFIDPVSGEALKKRMWSIK